MNLLTNGVGLASHVLFWVWLMWPWLSRRRLPRLRYLPLLAVPGLAWWSFGCLGPLCPVTWCWLLGYWRQPRARLPLPVLFLGAMGGLLLYASALGYIGTDVYAAGYHPHWLLLPIFAGALLLACWSPIIGWGCVLALLLFATHGLESLNVWDYVLDPVLWAWMVGQLGVAVFRRGGKKTVLV